MGDRAEQGDYTMSNHPEAIASRANDDTWKLRIFRAAYLAGNVVAMIGWLVALSWAGLFVIKLFV